MEELRTKQEEIENRDEDFKLLEAIIRTLGGKESLSMSQLLCSNRPQCSKESVSMVNSFHNTFMLVEITSSLTTYIHSVHVSVNTLVISKYGASRDYPPCTDLAYEKAISDGVDVFDCPVQMSKDGISFYLSSIDLIGLFTRKLLVSVRDTWDNHVLFINKTVPENWKASYGAYAGYGGNYANSQLPATVPPSTAYGAYPPSYPAAQRAVPKQPYAQPVAAQQPAAVPQAYYGSYY
ncbi:hypothetical protein V8G54_032234 [Vigna mungo]|uniref:glycerophosphodiester phosphodiesterase n=1 Tax=Vigna mungo TaxID=3915 RepID=A0AAQ3RGH7_VIGMU